MRSVYDRHKECIAVCELTVKDNTLNADEFIELWTAVWDGAPTRG